METEYKREMNRNYMVLHPEPGRVDRYTIRMLSGNQIAGLLSFQEKWMDGENRYYYDITSKQPLSRLLEYRNMTGEEMHTFVSGLLSAMGQMERFLLDENQICLEPEYIYVEPESFRCALLVIPGRYRDFTMEFRELCQYLLDHVNQNDGDAVILAFSVFKESQKENFGMRDVERCLERTEKQSNLELDREKAVCLEPTVQIFEEVEDDNLKYEDFFGVPKVEREVTAKVERPGKGKAIAVILATSMVLIPVFLLLIGGLDFLHRFKFYIAGAEMLLFFAMILTGNKEKTVKVEGEKETCQEITDLMETMPMHTNGTRKKEIPVSVSEESLQTVLLTARPVGGASRYLVPVGGGEEIPIRYFPFLIGKNKGIVDFYLNEDGISRLHAKLEECDGQYYVTDLNSTNGVMVEGAWLEANERRLLPVGSELILAASRFYFR